MRSHISKWISRPCPVVPALSSVITPFPLLGSNLHEEQLPCRSSRQTDFLLMQKQKETVKWKWKGVAESNICAGMWNMYWNTCMCNIRGTKAICVKKYRNQAQHVLLQPLGVWLMYRMGSAGPEAADTCYGVENLCAAAARRGNLLRVLQREREKQRDLCCLVWADCAFLSLHELGFPQQRDMEAVVTGN